MKATERKRLEKDQTTRAKNKHGDRLIGLSCDSLVGPIHINGDVSEQQGVTQDNHVEHIEVLSPKKRFIRSESKDMPKDVMETAFAEIEDGSLFGDLGGFSEAGVKQLNSNDGQNTISAFDLPKSFSGEVLKDLEFREENGYEEVSVEEASSISSIIGEITGTEYPIPNLSFELATLSQWFKSQYSYIGYMFPYTGHERLGSYYGSVKRVFHHISGSHIIVLEETTLKDGSSHLIKEFVNTDILGCHANLIEKRAPNGTSYGHLNWSTASAKLLVLKVNADDSLSGLEDLANDIAQENKDRYNCRDEENKDESLSTNTDVHPPVL
ncbi:MAG: hypothetical protein JKY67_23235 [Pseudomonadales bacterium]|nr:hypothetical protein [Pseudomonadales bacterium]